MQAEATPDKILNEEIEAQINYVLERCNTRLKLIGILDGSDETSVYGASENMRSFLNEFAAATDKLDIVILEKGVDRELEAHIGVFAYPIVALMKPNEGSSGYSYSGISYYGVPGGHELESFILSIYNVAGPGQPINQDIEERIMKLETPLSMKMCVSLSCLMCSELVQAGNRIAALNPGITAEMIDLSCFESIHDEFNIVSVPATIINGKDIVYGRKLLKDMITFLEERIR